MWKTSKLSQVGGKAFKFVHVKLQINKLDASLSVLVEHGGGLIPFHASRIIRENFLSFFLCTKFQGNLEIFTK